MGNLFSIFPNDDAKFNGLNNPNIDSNSPDKFVSTINFNDSDTEYISEPIAGDPCGLYVDGFDKNWSNEKLNSFLKQNNIKFIKANKNEGVSFATIYFDNVDDRKNAYNILSTVRFHNMILYVVSLTHNFQNTQERCKKLRDGNQFKKSIVDLVTPWHSIDYEEQIRQKVFKYSKIIGKIANFKMTDLINVVGCDKLRYYVNDVELIVGLDSRKKIAVGFNFGSKNDDFIEDISECINIPECAILLSKRLRKFIIKNNYQPFNRLKKTGLWKFVRIRTSSLDNKIMAVIGTNGKIQSDELTSKIVQEFRDINSLYYVETSNGETFGTKFQLYHLNGDEFLIDQICNFKYQIWPATNFPTSTTMHEEIIQQVIELGSIDKNTIVVDVDAGNGTFTFPLSAAASKVIAFEQNLDLFRYLNTIKDLNHVSNADLRNGYVEDFIETINSEKRKKVVCIIHSPHYGIRKKALYAIQKVRNLKKIVFITTNAEKTVQDVNDIFLNETAASILHFDLDSYEAVDTFPHKDKATVVLSLSC